ncbi:alpha/beta hydrolase [Herbiconiux sp. CPCC 205716]|uniref:Alpha/beta hydrolase n=1 Tax=Herbiconiux gentiana TaxID=2970912 RepID=A0ABT2GJ74_9MICO|nr:alpha/beta hydrolase [Herbiconiux gentiana]MCS5716274.1 alpha/beta hydrolase [Herbiconiux gentiana]
MANEPTIVLVHGAFADAASWAPVTRRLLDKGRAVLVPGVPNRSLIGDSEYIRAFVEQIDGPVLLVGHSYGGAVIRGGSPTPTSRRTWCTRRSRAAEPSRAPTCR